MSDATIHYRRGGHAYWSAREQLWVAVNYVRVLGRFATLEEAVRAVDTDAAKYPKVEYRPVSATGGEAT